MVGDGDVIGVLRGEGVEGGDLEDDGMFVGFGSGGVEGGFCALGVVGDGGWAVCWVWGSREREEQKKEGGGGEEGEKKEDREEGEEKGEKEVRRRLYLCFYTMCVWVVGVVKDGIRGGKP